VEGRKEEWGERGEGRGGGKERRRRKEKGRRRKRERKSTDNYILGSFLIWDREFKEYAFHKNLVLHRDGFM